MDVSVLAVVITATLLAASVLTLAYFVLWRSPHTLVRHEPSAVRLSDVVGATAVRRELIDSLNLFLNNHTFRELMGGSASHGLLLEGATGTGKSYLAAAMAAEANVPFLSVSATDFQSMFYGQTNRKIRSYFRALRRAARARDGAIGLIEEFDAIGSARTGSGFATTQLGAAGVVNELLTQMQRFDHPTAWQRLVNGSIAFVNRVLPSRLNIRQIQVFEANVLLIAATNRVDDVDPALTRAGRFDHVVHFDLPPRYDRIEIAEYYLARKNHELSVSADLVGDLTAGYTPARIEHLLDQALIVALRDGRTAMRHSDVVAAQLIAQVGLAQDVGYHPDERRRVAIHEAGHALAAALTGRDVKLASILRRSGILGLVAHDDVDERFLQTTSEARDVMMVALAGRAAEIQEFGESSSGVADDLQTATAIAAQLVGMLGESDSLLSLDAATLGDGANLVAKVLSDQTARAKANELMHSAADRAACAVLEHRRALLALADALIEQDELTGDEVHIIVAGALTT